VYPQAGVGITQAVGRLSVVVPVVAAILLCRRCRPSRLGGAILTLVAFPLLSGGQGLPQQRVGTGGHVALLAFFFLMQGLSGLTMKAYAQHSQPGAETAFVAVLFTAGAVGTLAVAACRSGGDGWDLAHGAVLGW